MHKIYFEKRSIIICHENEHALTDPNAIIFRPGKSIGIHALIEMFEKSDSLHRIFIPTSDVEGTYRNTCREFIEVNAGGGIVSNRRGDILMINRNGMWDLPKGHQDPGEDIRVTALREVSEETGINDIMLRELICITDHCYMRNGAWHLKHTWWYDMLYTDPTDLTPQREEDITKAAWVPRSGLAPFLLNTYPSIAEVFREAKL